MARTSTPLGLSGGAAPDVALNPAGTAFLTYLGPTGAVLVSLRPAGGSWTAAQPLSAAGSNAVRVAADANGNAVVAWLPGSGAVQADAYDATGPVIPGVEVPNTTTVGTPTRVSIGPAWDLWSTVAFAGWDFGDGARLGANADLHDGRRIGGPSQNGRHARKCDGEAPGASPATTPRPTRLTKAALRKLPKLRISIGVPKLIRRGAQTIVPVALSRAVHGTLATVQLRRGVGHLTVARGRVAGRRVPIALSSRSAGRYLLRVRFQEARKGTATEVVAIVVR